MSAAKKTPREPSDELPVKIILIGDLGVGKTTIIHKYCNYTGQAKEILNKQLVACNRKLKLVFHDTLGAEQMATVTSAIYQNCAACVFCYDPTNNDSVVNLNGWTAELKRYGPNKGNVPKYLCCNKSDLTRSIKEEDLQAVLQSCPLKEFKVSAQTGEGIDAMFDAIIPEAVEESIRQLKEKNKPSPPPLKAQKKGGCVLL